MDFPLWINVLLLIGFIWLESGMVKENRDALAKLKLQQITVAEFDEKYHSPLWFMLGGFILVSLSTDIIAQLIKLALQ